MHVLQAAVPPPGKTEEFTQSQTNSGVFTSNFRPWSKVVMRLYTAGLVLWDIFCVCLFWFGCGRGLSSFLLTFSYQYLPLESRASK